MFDRALSPSDAPAEFNPIVDPPIASNSGFPPARPRARSAACRRGGLALVFSTLIACGGGGGSDPVVAPPPVVPTISIADTSLVEGDAGSSQMNFNVSLSDDSAQTVTVSYRNVDGSARAGVDYQSASGSLSFAPGQSSRQIPVTVFGNAIDDGDRSFTIELSAPVNATIADGLASGTILDDDAPQALSGLDARPVNATCLAPPRATATPW